MTNETEASALPPDTDDRLRRWRLVLGGADADGTGLQLSGRDLVMDKALAALYDAGKDRKGGLGASAPNVSRWLGDIREYFPSSVVKVMQQDALERLDLKRLLLEPELLETVEPDVHLVATLISLRSVIPAKTRDTARLVVKKVVDALLQKLSDPMRQAVSGALNRAARNRRPRHREIDWQRTIRLNLKNYQPDYRTVIPETLVGYGRHRHTVQRDIIIAIDQSGSMASSVVYSSIFAAVMASLPVVQAHLVAFDTAIVDLSEDLHDPVELLFGVQLGGGTDINQAIAYCQGLVRCPADTVFVLISDLFEGGIREEFLKRMGAMQRAGIQVVTLLALSDEGRPSYDHEIAGALAGLGIPAFACTPDLFPDLMAAAIQRQELTAWAAAREIVTTRTGPTTP
ncbi:MAG: VWA domain-containing protein [Armatimonadota bacterium]